MKSYATYVGPTSIMAVGNDPTTMGHAIGLYFNAPTPVEGEEGDPAPVPFCGVNYVMGGDGMLTHELLSSLIAKLIDLEAIHIEPQISFGMDPDFYDQLASQDLSVADAGLFRAFFSLPTVVVDGKRLYDTNSDEWIALLENSEMEVTRAA